jgi:hypothetical protein
MAAQEAVERLSCDPPEEEESDGESEAVPLAVQLIRLLSLFAKSEYVWFQYQYRGLTRVPTSSLPSTCTPQIPIADAGTAGRT